MRFKSVLAAFIFIFATSFVGALVFIQTKSFGKVATKVISDLSQKKAQAKVGIKSLGISVFPPGIEFNQVSVFKDFGGGKTFEAEFGRLGIYLGLIELEDRSITLGEIRVSDSTIDYSAPEDKDKPIEEIAQDDIDKVFKTAKNLPVRVDTVILENTRVFFNHDLIEAKRLKISKRDDTFMARFHLANLKPLKEKDLLIDEIWGDVEVGKQNLSIQRIKVQHDVHTLLIKGKITNYRLLKNADVSVAGEATVHIQNIKDDLVLPELIKLNKGQAHLSFKAESLKQKLSGSAELAVSNLDSNIIHAEQIIASLDMKNDVLSLKKFSLVNKKEKAHLLTAKEIYNFHSKKLLYQPLTVHVENVSLTNALGILPSLSVLKGELNGDLAFSYHHKDMTFEPKDNFTVQKFALVVGKKEDPFTILSIKHAKLRSSSFRLVKGTFEMDSLVELSHSLLDVHGSVGPKDVDFRINDAVVDLEDFGNISMLDIKGKGKLDITVTGAISDTTINLKGNTKGFEVLGYKLGQAEKDLSIALGDSSVIIHKFESLYRTTPISGTGVVNYGNKDIALGITSTKANFHDLKEILHPIFSKISFLPADLDMNAKIDADIFGKTSMDQLRVKAAVEFTDLLAYGETVNSGDFKIALANQVLSIKDLTANKGSGVLQGNFDFNLKTEHMKLKYEWEEFALASFAFAKKIKLNLNGKISGDLVGEGSTKDYVLKLNGKMDQTKSQDSDFEDSLVYLNITPAKVSGKALILGNIIKSDFDYSLTKLHTTKVNLDVDAPNLKPFTTALLGQHLENEDFKGSLKFKLDTKFRGAFEELDLKANLEGLTFHHETFNVNYHSTQPQFLIEDGAIKRWNLAISEPDLTVQTKGFGKFGNNVTLLNDVRFNAKIFELLLSQVLSAEGIIEGSAKVNGQGDRYNFSATSKTNELNLTIENVPFPLNKLSYDIQYSDNRLSISDLSTTLENGSLNLKGDVFFDDNYPDINLKYALDKAEIPILGKSVVNLSGEGIILGNEPPYNMGGEVVINKAQIVNEINEFSPKTNALAQVRFLPPNQESAVGKLVNLNINVKIENPARITNSLMDISLKGEVMLMGNPSRPKGEGHLFSPPNSSRVFFKNSEYYITNADLNFSPKNALTNPDFDIQAFTNIASFKVYTKAYGDLERFNFDLTSDPLLPRNSILSLIAFGYTDDLQNTMSQTDKQNLIQVGAGSFVFDRFKISDILNKQFGLQVNLGTVLEQSQTDSLLNGRNSEGQGTLGRTRSATKIELKKRLDEALSLSVSSTMGGSIGQRQSMNLNYSVSKKVQLEGVYELRTNEDGQTDIIDNSAGGDLKFRWTFK